MLSEFPPYMQDPYLRYACISGHDMWHCEDSAGWSQWGRMLTRNGFTTGGKPARPKHPASLPATPGKNCWSCGHGWPGSPGSLGSESRAACDAALDSERRGRRCWLWNSLQQSLTRGSNLPGPSHALASATRRSSRRHKRWRRTRGREHILGDRGVSGPTTLPFELPMLRNKHPPLIHHREGSRVSGGSWTRERLHSIICCKRDRLHECGLVTRKGWAGMRTSMSTQSKEAP